VDCREGGLVGVVVVDQRVVSCPGARRVPFFLGDFDSFVLVLISGNKL
jgi:hypothetical protein